MYFLRHRMEVCNNRFWTILAAGLSLAAFQPAAAQLGGGQWKVSDLGTLPGGARSAARSINSRRWGGYQVVGYSTLADGALHAVLWDGSTPTDLGTLGGPGSAAYDVNNFKEIVGIAQDKAGRYRACFWRNVAGTLTPKDLQTLGGDSSEARAINDRSHIVGSAQTPSGDWHAALWRSGRVYDLGARMGGRQSVACDINNRGRIVGALQNKAGNWRATLWLAGEPIDLGTLGGPSSVAYALNDEGQIVGEAQNEAGQWRAVTWTWAYWWRDYLIFDLGALGNGRQSAAYGISSDGWIVGASEIGVGKGGTHAFVWDTSHGLRDLNDCLRFSPGWTLRSANSAAAGLLIPRIAGYGHIGGQQHAFSAKTWVIPALATPIGTVSLSSVPTGGEDTTASVTLRAPSDGVGVLRLSSDNPAVAQVPETVDVEEGERIVNFPITTFPVAVNTTVHIAIEYSGQNYSLSLTVKAPVVSALALDTASTRGGTLPYPTATVTLNGAAPAGGLTVTVSSNRLTTARPTVGGVNVTSITVPAGSTTGVFTVKTFSPGLAARVVTLSAKKGVTKTAALTVTP